LNGAGGAGLLALNHAQCSRLCVPCLLVCQGAFCARRGSMSKCKSQVRCSYVQVRVPGDEHDQRGPARERVRAAPAAGALVVALPQVAAAAGLPHDRAQQVAAQLGVQPLSLLPVRPARLCARMGHSQVSAIASGTKPGGTRHKPEGRRALGMASLCCTPCLHIQKGLGCNHIP